MSHYTVNTGTFACFKFENLILYLNFSNLAQNEAFIKYVAILCDFTYVARLLRKVKHDR